MCFTPKTATVPTSTASARAILPGPTPDLSAGVKPETTDKITYQLRFNYVRPSTGSKGFKTFGDFPSYAKARDSVQVTLDTLSDLAKRHFEKIEIISFLAANPVPSLVVTSYTPAANLGGVPTTAEVLADRLTGATALRDVYAKFYDFAISGYPLVEDEARTFGPEDQPAVRESFDTLVRAGQNTLQVLKALKAVEEELFTPQQQDETPEWLRQLFDGGSAFRVNLDNGNVTPFDTDADPADEDQGNNYDGGYTEARDSFGDDDDYEEDFDDVEEEEEEDEPVGTPDPVSPWQGCGSKR